MKTTFPPAEVSVPIRAELRYWAELGRLLADGRFRSPGRAAARRPVLLIPGFMAGDTSLAVLAGWLRRRGHEVRGSGMRVNVDCAGEVLTRLERVLMQFDEPAIVIGQSRGGTLARALADCQRRTGRQVDRVDLHGELRPRDGHDRPLRGVHVEQ